MKNNLILKNFRTRIIFHISGIISVLLIGGLSMYYHSGYFIYSILILVFIYLVYRLFRLVNRTNRDLANFLSSIRFDDFETSYTLSNAISDENHKLYEAFNLITDKFRNIRSEKEAQHQFYQAIIENIDSAIICFDSNGKTVHLNKAFKTLFHKSYLPSKMAAQKIHPRLYHIFNTLPAGENELLKIKIGELTLQLVIFCTVLKVRVDFLKLFVIQNINPQLEQQEMHSWQKLIRILTHEIMNSVSPVSSLASTTKDMIDQAKGLEFHTKSNLQMALNTIQKRSDSLLLFTEKYRELTRIQVPELKEVNLSELLKSLTLLYKSDFDHAGIGLNLMLSKRDIIMNADSSLLEQAFINLYKNALDVLRNGQNAQFEVRIYKKHKHIIIQFEDNGPGIEESMLDKIFIPFFSTKETGSGIGLSFCKQIVILHKGEIHVDSTRGEGTLFTVHFYLPERPVNAE